MLEVKNLTNQML